MKKLSLNAKIYFVLSIFIVACIVISILGLSKMSDIKAGLNRIVSGSVVRVKLSNKSKSIFLDQVISEKNIILEDTIEGAKKHFKRLDENNVLLHKTLDELYDLIYAEGGRKDLRDAKSQAVLWWENNQKIRDHLLKGEKKEAYSLSMEYGRVLRFKVEGFIDSILNRNSGFMDEEVKQAEADYNSARNLVIIASLAAIIFGLGLAIVILRAVGNSINQVIANLSDNSNQVTVAAQQIASSSEELSQAATEQASSLEETASSIEEMNSMIQKNAENAKRTSDLSHSSHEKAEKGKIVVQDMIKAIDDISVSNNNIMNQIDDSNEKIADIVKVIAEIGNKTKVINDIVFQTKLLSFNASVEAARAGEHGKGFAVVAEEVGNLAAMSGNAAEEISAMLNGSIQKVEGIVNETKQKVGQLILDGKSKVEIGSNIAKQCGVVLNEIVENVSDVTQMANEISTACQEQAMGVQEITKAMNQLDQVTQTNASTSEEAASAAEELSSQSESLRSTVGVLVQEIKGSNDGRTDLSSETRPVIKQTHAKKPNNIISLNTSRATIPRLPKNSDRKVSGYEATVPSENDPRFEEV